jgi:molybdopterin synthase sulfur carrier subunit
VTTRLLFFGSLREKAGGAERIVEIPRGVDTIASLVDWIAADDDMLKAALLAPLVRVAVDQEIMVDRKEPLRPAEEVAFMPPFSGG